MTEDATRCGFVALIGAPNAGKSTLLNTLVGTKVAIVSPKVQTTRSRVLGILTEGTAQIVFVDTPGIFKPRRRLDRAMVAAAWAGAAEGDLVLLLVDAALKGVREETRGIVEKLAQTKRKAILILNKIDAVRHEVLLSLAADLNATGVFTDTFMISALTGSGVDGAHPTRQRVTAAEGAPSGSLPSRAWRFISSAIVRPPSAASCSRRVAGIPTRLASPITAPSPRWRMPSSMIASNSSSSAASA